MKAAQLEVGRCYEDRKGNRRTIRMIADPSPDTSNKRTVYFGEAGKVHWLPIQEFAAWAKHRVN